jgi:dihydroneopterin aldolase
MKHEDKLIIKDLQAKCRVGVTAAERAAPQPIEMDLELEIDASWAAARDDVRSAVDYAKLAAVVKEHVEGKTYNLLETMAEEVAAFILREFGTDGVVVQVKKRALPGIGYAAVEVHRRAK